MNNSKRNLKIVSLIILAMAIFSLVWGIIGLTNVDISGMEIPEGLSPDVMKVITVIVGAFSLLLILPRIYIGIVGLRGGNENSRAHIIVAIVFGILSVISLISAITALPGSANMVKGVISLVEAIIVTAVYALYIKFANDVAKG